MIKIGLFLCVIMLSCLHAKKIPSNVIIAANGDSSLYKIYKIDSLNNYYLVYARREDSLYKIVSKKETFSGGIKVEVGEKYSLKLSSIWTKEIMIGGVNVSPSVTPDVSCLSFDDSTRICIEKDSINNLHQAYNLRGLYLIQR